VDTTNIKQDTSQIASLVQEMGLLRLQISQLEDRGGGGGVLLDRFLAESTIYAESVADTEDFRVVEVKQNPTSTILEEGDRSDSEATRISDDLDLEGQAAEIQPRQGIGQPSPPPMQDPLPVALSQMPVTDRDVDLSSLSDILPTGPPIIPPKVEQVSDRPHNKLKEPKALLQPDLEAMKVASVARVKLSGDKKQRLDEKLLLLLEGKPEGAQNVWRAILPRDFHVKFGAFSEVQALLDSGADPNVRKRAGIQSKRQGDNALMIELVNARRNRIIRLLLSRGADMNAQVDRYGTALLYVAENHLGDDRGLQLMEILLKYGADSNARGGLYGNALQPAACRGNLQAVELLLKYGAEVNAQGRYYGNALQAAAFSGNLQVAELLLKHGAEANAQGGYYGNALQAAVSWGNLQVAELLLKHGAEANAQGGYYGNALQAAASRGNLQVAELLLKYGADVKARGGHYGPALQAALKSRGPKSSERSSTIELLRKHGATEG
jgi:ankyrin repeat protein